VRELIESLREMNGDLPVKYIGALFSMDSEECDVELVEEKQTPGKDESVVWIQ